MSQSSLSLARRINDELVNNILPFWMTRTDGFNVFTILRRADDEVNLHSRFLAELFDPDGAHHQGDAFLDLFLKCIGVSGFELKNVQMQRVFQDPFAAFSQFYSIRRALENALNVLGHRLPSSERLERVENSLREVGLDPADVLNKWPHQLSGGQVQRVMIARALVTGPELLIADEPTSMLDASLRVTVLNLLVNLRKQHNMGIIFVTHDLGQAYYVCDRILVMYHGELVEQGPVEQVLANPQHDYTKRLLADVPRLHGWGAVLTKPNMSQ